MTLAGEAAHVLDGVSAAVAGVDTRKQGRVRTDDRGRGPTGCYVYRWPSSQRVTPRFTLEIDASPQALDLLVDGETMALRFQRPAAGEYVVQNRQYVPYGIPRSSYLFRSDGFLPSSTDDWSSKDDSCVDWIVCDGDRAAALLQSSGSRSASAL